MSEYLKKPVEEITKEELFAVDSKDLEEWLKDYFRDDAAARAEEKFEDGDIDYDQVHWEDNDYEPDYDD